MKKLIDLPKRCALVSAIVLGAGAAMPAGAVLPGHSMVQGNACIGVDCDTTHVFEANGIEMKENNTRVRWTDSTAAEVEASEYGEQTYTKGTVRGWRLEANGRSSGEPDMLRIRMLSEGTFPVLSNGTAPDYECQYPGVPGVTSRSLPEGVQAEDQRCLPLTAPVARNGLMLGPGAQDGVAFGVAAKLVPGEVALGDPANLRRLVHLAAAVDEADALIRSQLDPFLVDGERAQAKKLAYMVTELEAQVAALEAALLSKKPRGDSDADTDVFGDGGAPWELLPVLGLMAWRRRRPQ